MVLEQPLECDSPGGAFTCRQAHQETRSQGGKETKFVPFTFLDIGEERWLSNAFCFVSQR
jgi:hypothetical protein